MSDRQWSKKHPSDQQARDQNIRLFVATTRIATDRPQDEFRSGKSLPSSACSAATTLNAEALTRARRRLLTAHPDPIIANTPTSASPTVDQLRVLAASDWAPPRMTTLDAKTLATADAVTRAHLRRDQIT